MTTFDPWGVRLLVVELQGNKVWENSSNSLYALISGY